MKLSSLFIALCGLIQLGFSAKVLLNPSSFTQLAFDRNANDQTEEWMFITVICMVLVSYSVLEIVLGALGNRQFAWVCCGHKMLLMSLVGASTFTDFFRRYHSSFYVVVIWLFVTAMMLVLMLSFELPVQTDDPEPHLDEHGNLNSKSYAFSATPQTPTGGPEDSVSTLPASSSFTDSPARRRGAASIASAGATVPSRDTTPVKDSTADNTDGIHLRSGKRVPSNPNLLHKTD